MTVQIEDSSIYETNSLNSLSERIKTPFQPPTAYSLSTEQEVIQSETGCNMTHPFGAQMPGLSFSSGSYSYRFIKEKDRQN
jgi:hypothetical protein